MAISHSKNTRKEGRRLLEDAASLGRPDALLYIGQSFEMDGDYPAAEDAYLRGFEKRYRVAVFRLAVLHGKGLLERSDRDFYLQTIKALSRDGHFPSIALWTNERMRGAYGKKEQLLGFASFIPNVVFYFWGRYRNPNGHEFEQ